MRRNHTDYTESLCQMALRRGFPARPLKNHNRAFHDSTALRFMKSKTCSEAEGSCVFFGDEAPRARGVECSVRPRQNCGHCFVRVAMAPGVLCKDPSSFRHIATGHVEIALVVRKSSFSQETGCRAVLDGPIAEPQMVPVSGIAQQSPPTLGFRRWSAAYVAHDGRIRPKPCNIFEVVCLVRAQTETCGFQGGRRHRPSRAMATRPSWRAAAVDRIAESRPWGD